MRSRRTTSGITRGTSNAASSGMSVLGEQVHATLPLLLGVELIRADVAATVLGVGLGDVPCGGPITWALLIDGAVAGRTDEPLTDDAAQDWARRMLGDGARFQLAHTGGGYWLADTTDLPEHPDLPERQGLLGPASTRGGWSR